MVRIGMAQINPTVGDIGGNTRRIMDAIDEARDLGAQVVILPELVVTGYPPEDLVLKKAFVEANRRATEEVAAASGDLLVVVGFVDGHRDVLYNAAAICHGGEVRAIYHKHLLPNYGVFDEQRHFTPGRGHTLIDTPHGVLGVCVCEDAWSDRGPVVTQGDAGAQIVLNINASPFHKNKIAERTDLLAARAARARSSIVYVNCVGGQDELVFDGGSLVVDSNGDLVARFPQFTELVGVVEVPLGEAGETKHPSVRRLSMDLREAAKTAQAIRIEPIGPEEEIYEALKLSLRDYAIKNGFSRVVIGLSGGIDSALTAAIATDALGPDNVLGVAMPSDFSSSHSVDDAKALASNLGIDMLQIPIATAYQAYLQTLETTFGAAEMGVAEENLQARIRGNLLMAISNRYGHLVVATGNKSEMACGYATLYGDMAGGFALLKDVFKTEVYRLARYRNSLEAAIPESTMTKAPSAELRPGQKDADSLPSYEQLDPILEAYIEDDAAASDIVAAGNDAGVVEKIIRLVDRAEYKRRQAPPGPKVTTKAFGRDRRLPITNRWTETAGEGPSRSLGTKRKPDDIKP